MQEAVRLGLITGYPGRLTPGETRITRALKEIKHMREMDKRIEELRELGEMTMPTHAERFREIHGKSLDFFDEVLSTPVEMDNDNAKLLNIKLAAASKTIGIGARVAIELYRGQNMDALGRLLERMGKGKFTGGGEAQTVELETGGDIIVGFDSDDDGYRL